MNDGHSAQNVRSEHVFGATLIQHNQIENDMSSGGKNQELNQGVPEGFQQNRTEEQDLPPFEALHDSIAYHNDNVDLDNIMEDDLSPVCTQVSNPLFSNNTTILASIVASFKHIFDSSYPGSHRCDD